MWEGSAGSLAGPVAADATGGSQGFDQLVCFIGDFTSVMPTPAAVDAGNRTLAWLAQRYGIDTAAGSTVTFMSRGSNKWPAGAKVTTATVAGHRDMSTTACPGNAFYPYVRNGLQAAVDAERTGVPAARDDHGGARDDRGRDHHAAHDAPPLRATTTQPTTSTQASTTDHEPPRRQPHVRPPPRRQLQSSTAPRRLRQRARRRGRSSAAGPRRRVAVVTPRAADRRRQQLASVRRSSGGSGAVSPTRTRPEAEG